LGIEHRADTAPQEATDADFKGGFEVEDEFVKGYAVGNFKGVEAEG
jgi:hypothetical protein